MEIGWEEADLLELLRTDPRFKEDQLELDRLEWHLKGSKLSSEACDLLNLSDLADPDVDMEHQDFLKMRYEQGPEL